MEFITYLSKDYSSEYNIKLETTKFSLVCVSNWLFRLKPHASAILEVILIHKTFLFITMFSRCYYLIVILITIF